MHVAIQVIEDIFVDYEKGEASMPEKVYLDIPEFFGDFRAMPAYWKKKQLASIKWVNSHKNNYLKKLPQVMAVILLSDPKTGVTHTAMDGRLITAYRTGAAGGIATKYLSKISAECAAFIGCGVQAQYQLMALQHVRKIKHISVYDTEITSMRHFKSWIESRYGLKVRECSDVASCVKDAEIITLTTPSKNPILFEGMVQKGSHINAIGADAKGKQECEESLLKNACIYVDDRSQAIHSGEINVPISKGIFGTNIIKGTLGELVSGKKVGRDSDNDITVFDSTGLAIQDLALASLVLDGIRNDA
jgi:alanine dehydrogenase